MPSAYLSLSSSDDDEDMGIIERGAFLLRNRARYIQLEQVIDKKNMDPAERRKRMPSRIVAEFLTGPNLRKIFSHLCNNASGLVTDPISDTAVMMLTCPVQLILTEVGVALFKVSIEYVIVMKCTSLMKFDK